MPPATGPRTVQKLLVEDGHAHDATDKVEVLQVVGVDARVGVDLQRVVVVRRVREQTVDWIEHFVRQQKEPLAERRKVEGGRRPKKAWAHASVSARQPGLDWFGLVLIGARTARGHCLASNLAQRSDTHTHRDTPP